jgi:nucleotide-binding universal stress UspA family protein
MYKKIIVALDGSELAECVLPHVESISKSEGSEEVIFITVTERFDKIVSNNDDYQPIVAFADRRFTNKKFDLEPTANIPNVTGKILKQAQRYLAKIAEDELKKGVKASIVGLMGEAAEQIVDFAAIEKADLIIMASHGRSGFRRWTMGSVAEKVFHGSSVPILLVKAPQKDSSL